MTTSPSPSERINALATAFKLPTVANELSNRLVEAGHAESLETVLEVFELEAQDRRERRIERLRRASNLPPEKTFETMNLKRLPAKLAHTLQELGRGDFAERAENVLAFGPPGSGKTHAVSAIGHALVQRGRSVYYCPTFRLVQELLAAKRDLTLPRALRKLDLFEVLVLDDIGYVQQSAEEVEVLFTLLAERYERRSLVITSNLVFSQWDQIFKNPLTTAAAIDRVVHHAIILEFNVPSYRTEQARGRRHGASGESGAPAEGSLPRGDNTQTMSEETPKGSE
jgi:DNA replication protein DnaC